MPRVGPRKIKKGDRNKKERFVVLEEMIQEPLFGSLLLFFFTRFTCSAKSVYELDKHDFNMLY